MDRKNVALWVWNRVGTGWAKMARQWEEEISEIRKLLSRCTSKDRTLRVRINKMNFRVILKLIKIIVEQF